MGTLVSLFNLHFSLFSDYFYPENKNLDVNQYVE